MIPIKEFFSGLRHTPMDTIKNNKKMTALFAGGLGALGLTGYFLLKDDKEGTQA